MVLSSLSFLLLVAVGYLLYEALDLGYAQFTVDEDEAFSWKLTFIALALLIALFFGLEPQYKTPSSLELYAAPLGQLLQLLFPGKLNRKP